MHAILKNAVAASAMAFATLASAQITFYEGEGFRGRTFTTQTQIDDFRRSGLGDRIASVDVLGGEWQVCEGPGFSGQCVVVRPGRYASLGSMGLANGVASVRAANSDPRGFDNRYVPVTPAGQITFYEGEGYRGRTFSTQTQVENMRRSGFNERISSVDVTGQWEACEGPEFSGRCVILQPGRYPSLASMTLDNRIASVRPANRNVRGDSNRYAPVTAGGYDYGRRNDERLYQANVTSVHAVVGSPEQRCWIERGAQPQSAINVPGAIAGAVIGGILGHQVGHGTGRDIATVGGAAAGGFVGANIGGGQRGQPQDVQRCENVSSEGPPSYWDVTYNFQGLEHRVQMTSQPGPTIIVNEQGEPRT